MKAGLLREIIEIYKQEQEVTEFGDKKRNWVYYCKTKSNVLHKQGNLKKANDEITYSFTKQFIVRHYINIDENMRIKYKDRFYRILDIEDNLEMNNKVITAEVVNE